MADAWLLTALIFAAAALYSSVGHGGGSGYLAAMALFGLAPNEMRPAALVLNVIVAGIGTVRFVRTGHFDLRLFALCAAGAVPFAFLGGVLSLTDVTYKRIVGAVLLFAAARLLFTTPAFDAAEKKRAPVWAAILCGSGIGLLAGLTGTGGGIFLSPVLLFLRWADTKDTAGVSVAFILANSIAGLGGLLTKPFALPEGVALWAVAAALGGLIGSEFGSKRLGNPTLRKLLAVVLVVAGLKLVLA